MNFFRKVGGALEKFSKYDPLVGANPIRKKYFKGLNDGIANYMDPDGRPDPSATSYVDPFTGQTVKYKGGGKVKKFSKGGRTQQSGADRRAFVEQKKDYPARRRPDSKKAIAMGPLEVDVPNRIAADDALERAVKSGVSERTQKKLGAIHNKQYRPGKNYPEGPAYTGYKKGGSVRGDGCCTKGKTKGRMR